MLAFLSDDVFIVETTVARLSDTSGGVDVGLDPIVASEDGAAGAGREGSLVEELRVRDGRGSIQLGECDKSMAVNVRMRAADHTLSADEVLGVREAVIAAATGQLGAVLR